MNKILKSLVVGGLGLMMLPGMVKADVEGETMTGFGSNSSDAYVNSITDANTYDITVTWGNLSYDYVKYGNEYSWKPIGVTNYLHVANNSTADVKASISWEATIDGVTADYDGTMFDSSVEGCNLQDSISTWIWSGTSDYEGYNGQQPIYSDETCQTKVATNSEYDENDSYYMIGNKETKTSDTSVNLRNVDSVKWMINLTGGSKKDVQVALDSDSKIGTFTVTIASTEEE